MSHDEIRTELMEVNRALGRIEGRLDSLQGLEKRVGSLEGWRKWVNGAAAVIAALFAWVSK